MKKLFFVLIIAMCVTSNLKAVTYTSTLTTASQYVNNDDDEEDPFMVSYRKMNTPYQKALKQIAIDCVSMLEYGQKGQLTILQEGALTVSVYSQGTLAKVIAGAFFDAMQRCTRSELEEVKKMVDEALKKAEPKMNADDKKAYKIEFGK